IIGMVPAPLNSQETGKFVEAEVVKWGKLVKEAGIQPE
ncbi:MAG: tripartite tricarboxylate transporter substrate binding protein, partial [Burkholderiales bacterium]|nr:tripartite tricarboxylate transporter substrate binding protein [Burkholderiales bacterium]